MGLLDNIRGKANKEGMPASGAALPIKNGEDLQIPVDKSLAEQFTRLTAPNVSEVQRNLIYGHQTTRFTTGNVEFMDSSLNEFQERGDAERKQYLDHLQAEDNPDHTMLRLQWMHVVQSELYWNTLARFISGNFTQKQVDSFANYYNTNQPKWLVDAFGEDRGRAMDTMMRESPFARIYTHDLIQSRIEVEAVKQLWQKTVRESPEALEQALEASRPGAFRDALNVDMNKQRQLGLKKRIFIADLIARGEPIPHPETGELMTPEQVKKYFLSEILGGNYPITAQAMFRFHELKNTRGFEHPARTPYITTVDMHFARSAQARLSVELARLSARETIMSENLRLGDIQLVATLAGHERQQQIQLSQAKNLQHSLQLIISNFQSCQMLYTAWLQRLITSAQSASGGIGIKMREMAAQFERDTDELSRGFSAEVRMLGLQALGDPAQRDEALAEVVKKFVAERNKTLGTGDVIDGEATQIDPNQQTSR